MYCITVKEAESPWRSLELRPPAGGGADRRQQQIGRRDVPGVLLCSVLAVLCADNDYSNKRTTYKILSNNTYFAIRFFITVVFIT